MEDLKLIFASNLIRLRTAAGMTQAELGDKLSYSGKSVSKWERGEAVPDAANLLKIAEIFGVTVDALLREGCTAESWQKKPRSYSKRDVCLVALSGIWTLAFMVFVIFWILQSVQWIVFVCAVPVSLVVLLVLNSVWNKGRGNAWVVAALVLLIYDPLEKLVER